MARTRKSKSGKPRTRRKPSTARRQSKPHARGKQAIQTINQQTKELEKSMRYITKELEKAASKNYEALMKKAKQVWRKEFDEELKEPMLSQLVMSFLNMKMRKEYINMVRKQTGQIVGETGKGEEEQEGGKKQRGGSRWNVLGPFPTANNPNLWSAAYPNVINAHNTYDHPLESVGGECGGSLVGGGKKKRGKKGNGRRGGKRGGIRTRKGGQRGGSYNPFPISLPHYFPATIAQSYSPPSTGYLAGPSSAARYFMDIMNGSEVYNIDPATSGSLGDSHNSILNEPNSATDINYIPN
jgi:hypothetical protein